MKDPVWDFVVLPIVLSLAAFAVVRAWWSP